MIEIQRKKKRMASFVLDGTREMSVNHKLHVRTTFRVTFSIGTNISRNSSL